MEMITEGKYAPVAKTLLSEAVATHELTLPWRSSPQIQGYGVSHRQTSGDRLKDLALKVYVDKKKPKHILGDQLVPPKIKIPELGITVETDVEEIGSIELELDTARHRPAFPGCGLGHVDVTVGTFGCLVQKKGDSSKLYILSNSHILANEGLASIGDNIIQPGDYDGGNAPNDVIAKLAEFVPFDFNVSAENHVDAAIARVIRKNQVISKIAVIGVPPSDVGVARIGTRVKKTGRTTGFTLGEVLDTDFKTTLKYKKTKTTEGEVKFADQVLCTRYTAGGDSGSIVLHETTNKILGLHFAGSPSTSIFNKIHHVINELDIEIVTRDL